MIFLAIKIQNWAFKQRTRYGHLKLSADLVLVSMFLILGLFAFSGQAATFDIYSLAPVVYDTSIGDGLNEKRDDTDFLSVYEGMDLWASVSVVNSAGTSCTGRIKFQYQYTGCGSTCTGTAYSDYFALDPSEGVLALSNAALGTLGTPSTGDAAFKVYGDDLAGCDLKVSVQDGAVGNFYLYSDPSKDLAAHFWADDGEEPVDPRENPTATVLIPSAGANVQQEDINATGGEAYFFTVASDVLSTEYPSESDAALDVEVYMDDGVTLQCAMSGTANSSDVDGSYHWGGLVNHKTDGTPEPCPSFALSGEDESYKVRARWQFGGFDVGTWSDVGTFAVRPYDWVPPLDCGVDVEWFSPCWFKNIIDFLFEPSQSSLDYAFGAVEDFEQSIPVSWFVGTFESIMTGAESATVEEYGDEGGNPLQGDIPEIGWFFARFTSFYKTGTIAALFVAFVWVGVVVAAIGIVLAALGVEVEGDDDDDYDDQ